MKADRGKDASEGCRGRTDLERAGSRGSLAARAGTCVRDAEPGFSQELRRVRPTGGNKFAVFTIRIMCSQLFSVGFLRIIKCWC